MTKKQITAMIMDIIREVDYDTYKAFLPEYTEDPEENKEQMERLVKIVQKHLKERA